MRQKKGGKSLNNGVKRAGIYGDLLDKRCPLLLFRRIAGKSGCKPVGSFRWDFGPSSRKRRGDNLREPGTFEAVRLRQYPDIAKIL